MTKNKTIVAKIHSNSSSILLIVDSFQFKKSTKVNIIM
jgi:hypothetical protein